jgi:heptosyltransferase-3
LWRDEYWTELIGFIIHISNDFQIIEIGTDKHIHTTLENYINFTGIRPLQKIASLIDNAKLYIGIDSGFAHMANTLKKNSVILIGNMHKFSNYMPYSGYFQKHKDEVVVYHNGLLSEMPLNAVKNHILKQLDRIK